MKQCKPILAFVILIILASLVYADSWTSSQPSHSTLYTDTITSKTDGSSVNIADSQGLFVTGDITTLGKVGVGTTVPATKLAVNNAAVAGSAMSINRDSSVTGYANVRFDTAGAAKFSIGLDKDLTPSADKLTFYDYGAAATVMTITGDNVGIGTASPSSKLHVIGKATITGGVDPPYISFSNESYESIRKYAKNVEEHEKVMLFWNAKTKRIEVYVIGDDAFYAIDGERVN